MEYADFTRGFILKFERGEEFHETLTAFFQQKRIPSAFYQGIGALSDVELGVFSIAKNDYERHSFGGDYELITAVGNMSVVDGKPFPHTHVVLADNKCNTIAGHFFKGVVSVSLELFLFPIDIAVNRKADESLNFKSLHLPHHFVK